MSNPPNGRRSRTPRVVITILVTLVLSYGFLIAQEVLLSVWVAVVLFALYLFYRFVHAHERIATALEARSRDSDSGENH